MARKKNSEFLISWMTVTYRSVFLSVLAVVLLTGAAIYIAFPDSYLVQASTHAAKKFLDRITGQGKPGKRFEGSQQAHFTFIDGAVRVKKANSNTWSGADYSVPLERGDVVQTSSEGMAKIVFADLTSYTIKQDSLIVIEENSANSDQQTQVSVQVTTGTVDLSTGTYAQGSRSEVRVAGARASLAPESSAMVRNDPRADEHEILLKRGSGQVTRGRETVDLSSWEKVSFRSDSKQMTKVKEIGPPTLVQPANMSPVYVSDKKKFTDFSWTPVPNSHGYRIRISKSPYFSTTVLDKVVPDPQIRIPNLKEGGYYWVVTTIGDKGKQSIESERNQFSVVAKSVDNVGAFLELQPFVQHGHMIEIRGKTEPTARVMVNGQEVPLINPDGSFNFFLPLPSGESYVTVTAQNKRGGVKTEQKRVVIDY